VGGSHARLRVPPASFDSPQQRFESPRLAGLIKNRPLRGRPTEAMGVPFMIDRMRRKGMTRFVALTLIGLMSAAPAQAIDLSGTPRLQSLEEAVAQAFNDEVTPPQASTETAPAQSYETVGQGEASYYGAAFAGNRTASGERFDPRARTCAHRSLPLGTMLRVTNLANGRSVTVRVNDRGPFTHSRVLDMSQAAARDIDMIRSGKAMVRIEVIHTV
jgi:rare lipoprotein A